MKLGYICRLYIDLECGWDSCNFLIVSGSSGHILCSNSKVKSEPPSFSAYSLPDARCTWSQAGKHIHNQWMRLNECHWTKPDKWVCWIRPSKDICKCLSFWNHFFNKFIICQIWMQTRGGVFFSFMGHWPLGKGQVRSRPDYIYFWLFSWKALHRLTWNSNIESPKLMGL